MSQSKIQINNWFFYGLKSLHLYLFMTIVAPYYDLIFRILQVLV